MADGARRSDGSRRLVLVDGHSLAHRAYFALLASQRRFSTSSGRPTGAIHGFMSMYFRMLEQYQPSDLAVVFDSPGPTFRHEQYSQYKAQRPDMASDLGPQIDTVRQMLGALRVPVYALPGFEADDLLGTIACRAAAQDYEVLIVTGDRDALQLVGGGIRCILTIRGVSATAEFDADAVRHTYGLEPRLMRDVKALMGDPSDNIPGVRGIGEKTALKLVAEFGALEDIYAHLDEIGSKHTRALLQQSRDVAFASRELVTIDCAVPLDFELADLRRAEPDHQALRALLAELEFRSLARKLYPDPVSETGPGIGPATARPAPGVPPASAAGNPQPAAERSSVDDPSVPPSAGGTLQVDTVLTKQALQSAVGWLLNCEQVGLEFELGGPRAYSAPLTAVGLAGRRDGRMRAFAVPVSAANTDLFAAGQAGLDEGQLLNALVPLLSSPLPKAMHDAKPALVALGRRGVEGSGVDRQGWAGLPGLVMDTAVAAYLVDPIRARYDLGQLSLEFLRRELPPAAGLAPGTAAAHRALTVLDLGRAVEAELRVRALMPLWTEIELPLITVLARMELTGMRLDLPVLGQMDQVFSRRLQELTAEVWGLAGSEFNLNSTRQLAEVLFDRLGLPSTKRTSKGKVASTDAESLEALAGRHPIVPLILEYRQLSKLKGTYVDGLRALADPTDGRIRTVLNQTVTATGRLSSTEPNLQNIPIREEMGRQLRRAFVASGPGYTLLAADYSQIELRILAHLSGDPVLIESFELGQDIHRRTAAEVFGVPLEAVTTAMRQAAKAVNFGIIYGISDFGLARNLGVGRAEAAQYISQYFARYQLVEAYFAGIIEQARADGYVTTLLGRRRQLPDLFDANRNIRAFGERTARNTPIQGSAADIIKLAMVALDHDIAGSGRRARMVLQVHDELVFDTPRSELDWLRELVRDRMQDAYPLRVPVRVDVRTGDSWYEAKDA